MDLIVNYNRKKFYLIGPIIDELKLLEVLKGSEVFTKSLTIDITSRFYYLNVFK